MTDMERFDEEYLKKYRRCITEYTNMAAAYDVSEAGEEEVPVGPPDTPPGDNSAAAGAGNAGNGMGGAPEGGAMDAAMPEGGMEEPAQGADGFNPQGAAPDEGLPGMGGQQPMEQPSGASEGDEVIDVDDLTKSQEESEKKIDAMNDKFDKLMDGIKALIRMNKERDEREKEREEALRAELEKRVPTPQQRLTMRTAKSGPFSMTPDEYMSKYAPDNYSPESDNNGADDPQYQITKRDIDNMTDYEAIAKELDAEHRGLKDILNF